MNKTVKRMWLRRRRHHDKNIWNGPLVDGYHLSPVTGLPVPSAKRCALLEPIAVDGSSYTLTYTCSYICYGMYSVFDGDELISRITGIRSGGTIDTAGGDRLYVAFYSYSSERTVVADDISDIVLVKAEAVRKAPAIMTKRPYLMTDDLTYLEEQTR